MGFPSCLVQIWIVPHIERHNYLRLDKKEKTKLLVSLGISGLGLNSGGNCWKQKSFWTPVQKDGLDLNEAFQKSE